ncbi:hypothetical protein [Clostridium grantii]|uniref:Uncharacterized protein n=1 Tax=Clostridium grantii DSM 8605 TaxID=1121316 RepID=A0A1M5UUK3_9CLOT|nr:hypothetical protein [Clostridium grantii]SHH66518.1 hypothetical protein SAMN02745207_01903 [Clostridium grantii DSM 8605]
MSKKNPTNEKVYGPNKRGYLESKPKAVKSYSENDYVLLPDNITDSIVTNNIATSEFDYTYDGEDFMDEDLF